MLAVVNWGVEEGVFGLVGFHLALLERPLAFNPYRTDRYIIQVSGNSCITKFGQ